MSRHKIRANGRPLVELAASAGVSLDALAAWSEPAADGWHSAETLAAGLAEGMNAAARRERDIGAGPWADDEDPVDWARRTGRVAAAGELHWRDEYRRDPTGTGQALRDLAPVLEVVDASTASGAWTRDPDGHLVRAAATRSATPQLDALDRALFGPSDEERRAEMDTRAERELADAETSQREQIAASVLTPEEFAGLFGDDREGA